MVTACGFGLKQQHLQQYAQQVILPTINSIHAMTTPAIAPLFGTQQSSSLLAQQVLKASHH
jgi:hypothetical protein